MNKQDMQTVAHSLKLATTVIESAKQLLNKPVEDHSNSGHLNKIIDDNSKEIKELSDKLELANTLIKKMEDQNKQLINERDNWKETARRYASNEEHFRNGRDAGLEIISQLESRIKEFSNKEIEARDCYEILNNQYKGVCDDLEKAKATINNIKRLMSNASNQLDLIAQLDDTGIRNDKFAEVIDRNPKCTGPLLKNDKIMKPHPKWTEEYRAVYPYGFDPNAIEGE